MPQSKPWWAMTEITLCCQDFVVCIVGLLQVGARVDADCRHCKCQIYFKPNKILFRKVSCETRCRKSWGGAMLRTLCSVLPKKSNQRLSLCCSYCGYSDHSWVSSPQCAGPGDAGMDMFLSRIHRSRCKCGYCFKHVRLSCSVEPALYLSAQQ